MKTILFTLLLSVGALAQDKPACYFKKYTPPATMYVYVSGFTPYSERCVTPRGEILLSVYRNQEGDYALVTANTQLTGRLFTSLSAAKAAVREVYAVAKCDCQE
jgi:hypothetical protein